MQRAALIEPESVTAELIVETGAERRDFCISIYMPLISGGHEARQNGIRIVNHAKRAIELLTENGLRAERARRIVAPLFEISDEVSDSSSRLSPGLAIFISKDGLHYFGVDRSLNDQVVIGQRFYTRPLLELLGNPGRAYVLSLSKGASRLWEISGSEAEEVELRDMPSSMDDLTRFDDWEDTLRRHQSGTSETTFHGQGEGEDVREQVLESYIKAVRRAVDSFLDQRRGLFILASTEETGSIFENEANGSSRQVDHAVNGSFDRASGPEIRDIAHGFMEEMARRQAAQVDRRLAELTAPAAGGALTEIEEIVQAASQGRLSELLLAPEFHAEGTFDPVTGLVTPCAEPGGIECEDLADLAAMLTLRYGGEVHVAGPSQSRKASRQITAILRG